MDRFRWTGILLAAVAVSMVPSAAATDSGRPEMARPGPWLDVMLSQTGANPTAVALHERARQSYERMLDRETGN